MAHQQSRIGIHGQGGTGASSKQFGDTTLTKVFVGGLAWETQREAVLQYFEQFGEVLEAVVITDKNTGRSKGYGFVTFRDPEAARRACADPTPVIDSRMANCNLASLGAHRSRPSTPHHGFGFRPVSSFGGLQPGGQGNGGGRTYRQPVPYAYQQGFPYSLYGYPQYRPEYSYLSNVYNPHLTPQFSPVYGGLGTLRSPTLYPPYPFTSSLQWHPGFSCQQGYGLQNPQLLPYVSHAGSTITPLPPFGPAIPTPAQLQSTGLTLGPISPGAVSGAIPSPTHFMFSVPSQHFTPGGDPEQP